MALNVESGQAGSDSESYASVEYADAFHLARGNSLWATLATTEKEQALRRATEYLCSAYRLRWAGYRVSDIQALDWPRYEVPKRDVSSYTYSYYDYQSVPEEVKKACASMAFKAAQGDLAEDLTQRVVREKIGPIETEYDSNSPQAVRYRSIDMLLAPLLNGMGGANVRLVRA